MKTAPLSLKGRALKYLAAREHSRVELARKLAATTEDTRERIDAMLDELQARGFLSDQRFVDSVLHRRAPQQGIARIKRELQANGVDPATVREAVQSLHDSELARATALWQRRYGSVALDERERARQARFLLTRGFSASVVQHVLRGDSFSTDE